jgi:hypothetical protein
MVQMSGRIAMRHGDGRRPCEIQEALGMVMQVTDITQGQGYNCAVRGSDFHLSVMSGHGNIRRRECGVVITDTVFKPWELKCRHRFFPLLGFQRVDMLGGDDFVLAD